MVPPDGTTTIRVAALRRGDAVDVAIRSSDTGFLADHFRATLRYGGDVTFRPNGRCRPQSSAVLALDPATDLYGGIFFQGKRFQRVLGYRRLAATSCVADISALPGDGWFAAYLPAELRLGDPGARDAFMHAHPVLRTGRDAAARGRRAAVRRPAGSRW